MWSICIKLYVRNFPLIWPQSKLSLVYITMIHKIKWNVCVYIFLYICQQMWYALKIYHVWYLIAYALARVHKKRTTQSINCFVCFLNNRSYITTVGFCTSIYKIRKYICFLGRSTVRFSSKLKPNNFGWNK